MPYDESAYGPSPEELQQQQRVDAAFNEMRGSAADAEVLAEVDLMTEARTRFAKAALYEQIIEGQLFEGNDPVTLAVEDEFKTFAEERLRILLGMESEGQTTSKAKFEQDEFEVLRLFAAKLLGRPASIPRPETAKLTAPRPTTAPPASPQGQLAAPKRGRGRPPGTGKHQRAQAAAAAQQRTAPVPPPQRPPQATGVNLWQPKQPAPAPTALPKLPVPAADPQATKTQTVQLPNGQVREVPIQRFGGQVREAPTGIWDPHGPKPMPSPDEQIAQAQALGEMGARAFDAKVRDPDSHVVTPTKVNG